MIDVNKDLTNTISKPDEKNPRPRKKSQNKNEHINTQKPPSRTSGEYRKRSEVETGNTQGIPKYSFNEPTDDPIEVGASNQPIQINQKRLKTSSDEPYGNQNTKIKNLKRQIHHLAEMNVLTFNMGHYPISPRTCLKMG